MRVVEEQEESFLNNDNYEYESKRKRVDNEKNFKGTTLKLLGIFQFILGTILLIAISILIGILSDRRSKEDSYLKTALIVLSSFAYVYWCVIFFAISGIIGIISGYKKDRCLIISFMILSIFSSFFCLPLLFVSGTSLFIFRFSTGIPETYGLPTDNFSKKLLVVASIFVVVCSILEGILGVISSVLCCAKVCCIKDNQKPNPQPVKFIEMKNFQDDSVYHSIRSRNELQFDPMNTTKLPSDYLGSFFTQFDKNDA